MLGCFQTRARRSVFISFTAALTVCLAEGGFSVAAVVYDYRLMKRVHLV